MGYYKYQDGLIHRHLGQEGGWDSHLKKCRDYILKAVSALSPSTITVLGSGWLLDLPLAELAETAGKIYLADIVHPPEVARQTSGFRNVELIETDITGGFIIDVWNKSAGFRLFRKEMQPDDLNVPDFDFDFDPGLVVSLNLLTQLENLPLEFLKKKTKLKDEETGRLRRMIQEAHVSFLMRHDSILISDYEEVFVTGENKHEIVSTMLVDPFGSDREEWTWDFDQKGSDFYNSRSTMRVVALTMTR